MSSVPTPATVLPEDYAHRFLWNVDQFRRLWNLGFFGERKVELLDGVIYNRYPEYPPGSGSRPIQFSREQYRRMGDLGFFDSRRVELLHGQVVEMSPQGWPHALVKGTTADALRAVFAGVGWVSEQSPYPTAGSDPEPDVAVVPGRRADFLDHPTVSLLVVEVADTTLDQDTTVKAELYATAGVADYWVVDVAGRQLLVFRDPRPIPDGGAAYRTRQTFGPANMVSPLAAPAATIRVADLLP